MIEPVKPRRKYASTRRRQQAGETRLAVLDAARDEFIARGWQPATIAAIAARAGVSAETIYATFGNKRALLESVIGRAVRGASPDVPLLEQEGPRRIAAAATQARQLAIFARDIVEVLGRVAPLIAVVRAAADADPELATLYANLHAGRRRNLEFVVDALLSRGKLRASRNEAIAAVSRLASPELFLVMRNVEGLEPAAIAKWLVGALERLLLP